MPVPDVMLEREILVRSKAIALTQEQSATRNMVKGLVTALALAGAVALHKPARRSPKSAQQPLLIWLSRLARLL